MNIRNYTVSDAVDELGHLQAQIADLKEKELALKDAILAEAGGEDRVNGKLFAVTISRITGLTRFDTKLAKSYLTDAQIEACTVPQADQTRVTVRARK